MLARLTPADIRALERSVARDSLADYLAMMWPILDPGTPYLHNWHMDALGEHLQAVASGQITRLLINYPPGTSKSTGCSVAFPSWLWGPGGKPHWRFIGASHEASQATRDNRKTRLIIESDWFQERWPLQLTTDQNEKTYFENEHRGFRQSCAVASMTGKRGNVVVWDDPINPEQANSETTRDTAIRVLTETLPTRMVDPRTSAIVIMMQRIHENDPSGYILRNDLGFDHLCLPMEFEPDRCCVTSIGFRDPRTHEGELLHPERFPREVVERDKKAMTAYAVAGQFQQRPGPRTGGVMDTSKIEVVEALPAKRRAVRAWDLAGTKKMASNDPPYTAGVKMSIDTDDIYYIEDVNRFRENPTEVEKRLKGTATQDGLKVKIYLPQDPGQAGKAQAQYLVRLLAPHSVKIVIESGDKETRAEGFAAQVGAGNVRMLRGPWNDAYIAELQSFPSGRYKDQVDASSTAFHALAEPAPTFSSAPLSGY